MQHNDHNVRPYMMYFELYFEMSVYRLPLASPLPDRNGPSPGSLAIFEVLQWFTMNQHEPTWTNGVFTLSNDFPMIFRWFSTWFSNIFQWFPTYLLSIQFAKAMIIRIGKTHSVNGFESITRAPGSCEKRKQESWTSTGHSSPPSPTFWSCAIPRTLPKIKAVLTRILRQLRMSKEATGCQTNECDQANPKWLCHMSKH